MNPDYPHVDSLDDLPVDPPEMTQVFVVEYNRLFIFDGFKWKAEGDGPGSWIEHYPPQPTLDTDFHHCLKCVGIHVLTTHPPQVQYECEMCGGGREVLAEMTATLPIGPIGPKMVDSVAHEGYRIIHGERAQQYGDAQESFERIAGLWSAYMGMPVTGLDVANMMIMLKVSRTKGTFHRDSYVDIVGYAALAEQIAVAGQE